MPPPTFTDHVHGTRSTSRRQSSTVAEPGDGPAVASPAEVVEPPASAKRPSARRKSTGLVDNSTADKGAAVDTAADVTGDGSVGIQVSPELLRELDRLIAKRFEQHEGALSAPGDKSKPVNISDNDGTDPGAAGPRSSRTRLAVHRSDADDLGDKYGNAAKLVDDYSSCIGSDGRAYVQDLGVQNVHANPVYAGNDTLLRPQRYLLGVRDATSARLSRKPNGTLFEDYRTLEPCLRYLFNVNGYLTTLLERVDGGEQLDSGEVALALERLSNTIGGVYNIINRRVAIIHLRANHLNHPDERAKAKLQHVQDRLAEDDFYPASLDVYVRQLLRDFDDDYDRLKKSHLAKQAAGAATGKGGGGDASDRSAKPKAKKSKGKPSGGKQPEGKDKGGGHSQPKPDKPKPAERE